MIHTRYNLYLLFCFSSRTTFEATDCWDLTTLQIVFAIRRAIMNQFDWRKYRFWALAVLVIWSGNWSASAVDSWLHLNFNDWRVQVAQVMFFFWVAYLLYRNREAVWSPRTRFLRDELPNPRPHLVLFLSNLDREKVDAEGWPLDFDHKGSLDDVIKRLEESKRDAKSPSESVSAARPKKDFWNWEMPLRAIRHHAQNGVLQSLTLVCSEQSVQNVTQFHGIFQRYQQWQNVKLQLLTKSGNGSRVVLVPTNGRIEESVLNSAAWNFESFDELFRGIRSGLAELRRYGAKDHEIVIDFTGGQKVTSVIAATATYDLEVKAQYVQTNDPWQVRGYDVVVDRSETVGLG